MNENNSKGRRVTLLFPAARRRVALIEAFRLAFLRRGYNARIIVSDINASDPITYIADASFYLPDGTSDSFLPEVMALCQRESVDIIVPWQDTDIAKLAEHLDEFVRAGIWILISPKDSVIACIDKTLTAKLMSEAGLRVPEQYLSCDDVHFPAMVKPVDGAGSVNAFRCNNEMEIAVFSKRIRPSKALMQEYISGSEFTVDCFADKNGQLVSTCPRRRAKVRGGEVLTSMVDLDEAMLRMAKTIADKLRFFGPFNFQSIRTEEGEDVFIEINPRFSGGCTLSIEAGWNAPAWTVDLFEGITPLGTNTLRNGLHMMRYHSALYIDGEKVGFTNEQIAAHHNEKRGDN